MGILISTLYKTRVLRPHLKFRNLTVPVDGDHVTRTVWKHLWKGGYERPEIEASLALLRPGDRVLELGTGMGVVSGVLAKSDKTVSIQTFEANPNLGAAISKLHQMNGIENVITSNSVLFPSASEGDTISFNLHENFTESSFENIESSSSTEVPVLDFQTIFDAFSPDIMICDIEGSEGKLFDGISLKGLRALVIELHPKLNTRNDVKRIYDTCSAAGLYPRIDLSDLHVEVFERLD